MSTNHYIGGQLPTLGEIDLFNQSLQRVLENQQFLNHFYNYFMQSSTQIANIFQDVDMNQLKSKLATTLDLMTTMNIHPEKVSQHLKIVGRYHQNLSVPHNMYGAWKKALLCAVGTCDQEFTIETEIAWSKAADVAISKMHEGYV